MVSCWLETSVCKFPGRIVVCFIGCLPSCARQMGGNVNPSDRGCSPLRPDDCVYWVVSTLIRCAVTVPLRVCRIVCWVEY
jgi:hypothetical protein